MFAYAKLSMRQENSC